MYKSSNLSIFFDFYRISSRQIVGMGGDKPKREDSDIQLHATFKRLRVDPDRYFSALLTFSPV